MFGFNIAAREKETVSLSWEARIKKLRGVLVSWRERDLPTLEQRVQVVNVYLTTSLWYAAQVLPLPTKYQKQIDSELGRFITKGRITMGRLKLPELCHPMEEGGLGLWDTGRKAKALLTSQTCRMLRKKGSGWRHLSFWLEASLRNTFTL